MPGIEFVGEDTGGASDDDVLETGPRRPVPRWAWLVAAALVVAVGIGLLVSSRSGSAPAATPSAPSSAAPTGPTGPTTGPEVSDLASDGTSLFWIAGTKLYRAGPDGRISVATVISPLASNDTELLLVADPAERTIWVVSHGSSDGEGRAGTVAGFATDDLHSVTHASAKTLIGGAAALDGALFVVAEGKLLRITAHAPGFTTMASVDPTAHDLVAAGGTLLYVEGGNSSAIGQWTPSGVQPPSVLETVDNTLAVAGSTVFVLGTTRDQEPELDTLSTVSLGLDEQALATGLEGPWQLVATGQHSVIVLGTGRRGDEFACVTTTNQVDAPGPAKVQALAVSTSSAVTVLGSRVYQGDGDAVRPVTFNVGRCST